jgi:predicted acyltransferase
MIARPQQRDQSLDSFRGIDVLLMIIVNVQGKDADAFALLKHAEWTGMTFADLVFPVFLLIVGLSAPLALDRPGVALNWPAILRRTALLFVIGVILSWLIKPTLDPALIRWTGVLQRIAIVYLICVVAIVVRRGWGFALSLAALFLILHSLILLIVGSPTGGGPSMEPGLGISGWLDQNFIPGRVLRKSWEPEGILSTLSAAANGLIGVAIARWMQRGLVSPIQLAVAGAALIALGLTLTPVLPFNKSLWTASFALTTCGIGTVIWAGLKMAWPVIRSHCLIQWTVSLGQAALTLYVVHTLLLAIIVRKLPNGEKIWTVTYDLLASTGLHPGVASLLYACVAAGLSCTVVPFLKRRGWILKV